MFTRDSEAYQQEQFVKWLSSKKILKIYEQVPLFSRIIDVVLFDEKKDKVTAVELKIYNWKKAIEQALAVTISFDYIEICIMKPKTPKLCEEIEKKCIETGIGLFFTEKTNNKLLIEHIVKPKIIKKNWELQKKKLKEYLIKGELADG